ncbi:MAG: type 4a pilus biogenesis protein PilO [Nitrospiraceae bacterium]|nr:type 4a pilus biogenesis protein PilO [Nitrospiraceae bacterium]
MAELPKLSLDKVSKPARIAIAIVPALVFALVFSFLVLRPKIKQIKSKKADIAAQMTQISTAQSTTAQLPSLIQKNQDLRNRLKQLSEQLPEEKEVSQLLSQVSDKALQDDLLINSWRPSGRSLDKSKIVYRVPVSVTMNGSYHHLGKFFSDLTKLKRIVNITDIKMNSPAPKGNEAVLSISFTAVTFTAAEEGGLTKEK